MEKRMFLKLQLRNFWSKKPLEI